MVLLHFARWLRDHTDLRFEFLFRFDGDLLPEFAELAPVHVYHRRRQVATGLVESVRWRLGVERRADERHHQAIRERLSVGGFSLVHSNTVANGRLLEFLAPLKLPVVTHVHELDYVIRDGLEPGDWDRVVRHTSGWVAASQAVRNNLVEGHGLPADRVTVIHEFIAVDQAASIGDRTRDEVRRELGIPSDALVVGCCGSLQWRKAPDLFIQLARATAAQWQAAGESRPLHFVWVGGKPEGLYFKELLYDVRQCGLLDRVQFVPEQPDPRPVVNTFDLFALVSREDPYPLVCLEAAALKQPIICFEGAGGMPEFVGEDCGGTAPYLDVAAMSDEVVRLLSDPAALRRAGRAAAKKVRRQHDVTVAAPQLHALLSQYL